MQKLPHQHFGFGILARYAAHIVAAGFLAVHIGHVVKLAVFSGRWAVAVFRVKDGSGYRPRG